MHAYIVVCKYADVFVHISISLSAILPYFFAALLLLLMPFSCLPLRLHFVGRRSFVPTIAVMCLIGRRVVCVCYSIGGIAFPGLLNLSFIAMRLTPQCNKNIHTCTNYGRREGV